MISLHCEKGEECSYLATRGEPVQGEPLMRKDTITVSCILIFSEGYTIEDNTIENASFERWMVYSGFLY